MLVSMTLYIFRGTSPSSGVQMYTDQENKYMFNGNKFVNNIQGKVKNGGGK